MNFRGVIVGSALLTVSVVISLAAVEFGTRLLYPALIPSGLLRFEPGRGDDPPLGPRNTELRQTKNTGDFDVIVRFNKYGLRDTKDFARSTAQDWFVVGDSLSFGWGVAESRRYSNLLEAALEKRVFNISGPGNMAGYVKLVGYAKRNGATVRNLILGVSMETNIADYDRPPPEFESGPKSRFQRALMAVKHFLMQRSAAYFLVTSVVHRNPALRKFAIDNGLIIPMLEGIAHKSYSRPALESTARLVARLARPYNAVVMIAPSRALWYGSAAEMKTADRIHGEFLTLLKNDGLDVINLRDAFEKGGAPLQYSFKNDAHWTPRGHALAARTIFEHLTQSRRMREGSGYGARVTRAGKSPNQPTEQRN